MTLTTESFQDDVYNIVAQVPYGRVITYGQIATLIGRPQTARLVGYVLHGAAEASGLPCHRVVNAQGRLVPGWTAQRGLLESEGIEFRLSGCVDLRRYGVMDDWLGNGASARFPLQK